MKSSRARGSTRLSRSLFALVSFFLLPVALPVCAQEAPPLRVEVRLVNVDVAVTDPAGNFVADLKAANFRLQEDGAPQTIAHFAPTRAPVRILLLVEASPAVFLLRGEHLVAAHLLLRHLRPEDEAALASYARTLQPQAGFTRDKAQVEQQLLRVSQFGLEMADLNLLDAVAATLDQLSPPPQRTAVLIIGTGLDSGSRVNREALQQRIGASQITFFTIATGQLLLGKEKDTEEASPFIEGEARLRALAEASAGQAYSPKSLKELDRTYEEIGELLRNLYSLGYYPANAARDGRYRAISVELVDEAGAPLELRDRKGKLFRPRVFARPGYFAPRN